MVIITEKMTKSNKKYQAHEDSSHEMIIEKPQR